MGHYGGDENAPEYYGTVALADTYFDARLHETDWTGQSDARKEKALLAATRSIDALRYAGYKVPVQTLLDSDPNATDEEIAAASATQELEFPRGSDAEPPEAILLATYELAHELLLGRDPGREIENLYITSDRIGSTGVSRDTTGEPVAHIANGIVSYAAWRYLMPYLANVSMFDVKRV